MTTPFETIVAIILVLIFFVCVARMIQFQHPCDNCKYYVKRTGQCTFNPIYGFPVPENCPREDWSI